MELSNHWVWTKLTETIHPDRKAGTPVHKSYLIKGRNEYFPYPSWIEKGYVEKNKSIN